MTATVSTPRSVDVLHPEAPKRILILASDPAVSNETGWDIGFWWEELTHSYWAFSEAGYQLVIASPKGGALLADRLSDPRDEMRVFLISLGRIYSRPTRSTRNPVNRAFLLSPRERGGAPLRGSGKGC